jgi:hypothetical protein
VSDTTDDSRGPDGDPLRDPTAPDWAAPMSSGDEPAEASDAPVPSEPGAQGQTAPPAPTVPPIDATQSIDPSVTAALPIPPPAPPAPPAPIANPYGAPPANPYAGPPANPYATPLPGGQGSPPPTAPQAYPYGGPPQLPPPTNPYAAYPQQGGNPYATGPSGQTGYPQPGYAVPGGQPPFAYRPAQPGGTNVSAIVLLILSALSLLGCCIVEIPAVILAIVALTKQNDDPEGSKRITKYGWIAFAVGLVIAVVVVVILFAAGVMSGGTSSDGYSY